MKQSEKVGLYSIVVNLSLVGIKTLLFLISGSVALMADAIHSFSDVISSATVLAGIKISKRRSKNFPYGLYKVENFVSLLSSAFIFLAGYEIVKTVFFQQSSLNTEYLPYTIGGVLLTMGITFAFSRYELRKGKEIGSPSLVADAQHIRTDMLSSAVIMAGLVGGWFGLSLDKAAALVVVFLVFKAGLSISIDAIRVLLDASIDFETMDRVKSIIMKEPRVICINTLLGRNSGPFKFIEADIVIKAKDLEKAHSISRRIEKEIRRQVAHVDHILIHYEPQKKETTTYAIPLRQDKGSISDHFGDAPYFQVITIRNSDGSVLSDEYCLNSFAKEEKGKGIKVSEWLLKKGVDTVCSPKGFKGSGPGYVFSDAGVDIIVTEGRTLEDILQSMAR
ncbi:MAG: cation diffusion facilitator family transporter [Desulfatiglans sp.]|nr:cation diffusion facilitator family transporter [Thermodesulfobacteriota bacterium]MEE4352495.1 cation diffusion facilitator family transporter [Desulfatiglans sp.]